MQKRSLESFTLEYETRKDSKDFLDNIIEKTKEESNINIDYLFMYQAYQESDEYLCEIDDDKIYSALTFINRENTENDIANNVRIIWYELDNNDKEQELFVRINTNKIPLTNAELIKALFLHAKNFKNTDSHERQIEMAKEFDEMEYALKDDSFYYFLTQKERSVRSELIFEIFANTKDKQLENSDKYALYRFFANQKEISNLLKLWSNQADNTDSKGEIALTNIKKIFLTLKSWQKDRELYHLVGFLITTTEKAEDKTKSSLDKELKELYKISLQSTKSAFKEKLYKRIKAKLEFKDIETKQELRKKLSELSYDVNNKSNIQHVLLFFNVATILNNQESYPYFDFFRYKSEDSKWSLEHIFPQNPEELTHLTQAYLKNWFKNFMEKTENISELIFNDRDYKKAKDLYNKLELNKEESKITLGSEKEQQIKEFMQKARTTPNLAYAKGKEIFDDEKVHTLGNLTLLSQGVNSAFSNQAFRIKREMLKDKNCFEGSFIPLCTKNVFVKYYSQEVSDFWTDNDAEKYFDAIVETISKALKLKEE